MPDKVETIFEHQIEGPDDYTLTIRLLSDRKLLILEQNGEYIFLDRWQCLELATELLNVRKYLKTGKNK